MSERNIPARVKSHNCSLWCWPLVWKSRFANMQMTLSSMKLWRAWRHERNVRELGPSWLRSASFPRWVSLQRLFILLMLSWMLIAGKLQKASWSGSMSRPHLFISGTCLLPQPWLPQVFKFPLCPLMDLLSMIYWQTIPTKGHPWFILRYSLADHKDRRRTIHCVFFKTGNQRACPRNHWWVCQLIC